MILFLRSFILLVCSSLLGTAVALPKSHHQKVRTETEKNSLNHRAERYLFPFALINFPPEPCAPTNSPTQMEGVCVSRQRCKASGGESAGACQQGIGTCCKFPPRQCPANKKEVMVTEAVENLMTGGSCEFIFPKQPGICQVRLDFTNVVLQEPYTSGPNAGNCQAESITVVGATNLNGPLKVCGRLAGQHMILSYGTTSEQISVIVHSETVSQTYSIRTTQISCNSVNKAPDDCLQYFTATTAPIKSFGFPKQLNNQKYTICVKPNSGGSTFTWDHCMDMDVPGDESANRFKVSEQSTPCLTDWIAIDSEKRCGKAFSQLVSNSGSHARIRVHFDENETGNDIFNVTFENTITDETQCKSIVNDLPEIDPADFPAVVQEQLCSWNTTFCECKFSNTFNKYAQLLKITVVEPTTGTFTECPSIQGYTADSLTPSTGGECIYYANIRVTDINNTGFCLRYQAM